jgi:transcriptional regulator with XRE-family HTH domain
MKQSFAVFLNSGTAAEVARKLNIDSRTIYYWKRGDRKPSAPLAARIYQITKGGVSWADIENYTPAVKG